MNSLIKDINHAINIYGKNFSVFISSSPNVADKSRGGYVGGIRKCDESVLVSVICQSESELLCVLSVVSSIARYIFIETDKMIEPSGQATISSGFVSQRSLENLFQVGKEYLASMSMEFKLRPWKPNDITVRAALRFVQEIDKKNRLRVISLIGLGNIGSKLSLALCESGYKVKIVSRDYSKAQSIVNAINLMVPKAVIARCILYNSMPACIAESDLLISCSSSPRVINPRFFSLMNDHAYFLDIGKEGLLEAAIDCQRESQQLYLYRLDIGYELTAFYHTSIANNEFRLPTFRILDGIRYIEKGVLGAEGDCIVDNIHDLSSPLGRLDKNLRIVR